MRYKQLDRLSKDFRRMHVYLVYSRLSQIIIIIS